MLFLFANDGIVYIHVQLDVGLSHCQLATVDYHMFHWFSSSVLAKSSKVMCLLCSEFKYPLLRYYFGPIGVQSVVIRIFVCMSVWLSFCVSVSPLAFLKITEILVKITVVMTHFISLMTVQYVIYFRFVDDVVLSCNEHTVIEISNNKFPAYCQGPPHCSILRH